ncbi:MAG TPA: FHA domain-containing protein, partial [Anaerolineales bacterium]|nr:FHA domain-containing protein [Anaerolineales bacterium]
DLGQKANLDTLGRAIDIAADPTPRPGMSRALLYITPLLDAEANPTLQSLGVQAQQQDIQVFVWMVSAPGMESNTGAEGLIDLANTSGGQFFAFSGAEGLPDLETYLRPLRSIYRLGYISQISTGGTHQLSAEIQTASGEIISDPLSFDLSIRPPNPVFVSPQLEINRRPPNTGMQAEPADSGFKGLLQALLQNGAAQPSLEPADYLPQAHSLQVIFDFPDQHPRPLNRTALFVDGQIVDENLSPPFDQFEWNLESYSANGLHRLRAEAEDMLGLTGSSIEIYVQVDVAQPAVDPWAAIVPHAPALAGLALVLLIAVDFLGLILGGRIRPHPLAGRRARKPRQPAPATVAPVTIDDPSLLQNWVNRLHWPQRRITPTAQAFLVPMGGENSEDILPRPTAANLGADKPRPAHLQLPAPLAADEITLGQDPNQATLVLSDASVQGLHARLRRSPIGEYIIYDENSIAGTWVNYELANPHGHPLEHGDVVHIGRLGFRFTVRNPQRTRRPVVVPMTPANGSYPEEAAP